MYEKRRIEKLIELWLDEDVAHYDLTSKIMIEPGTRANFVFKAREPFVLCGIEVVGMIMRRLDPECVFDSLVHDGAFVATGVELAHISGDAQAVLTAERVALNVLQRLSGIATITARYVKEIEGTSAQLVDTRKTTPGLRILEKYAVQCGGGRSHRLSLDNGIMLKDNHIAVCGGITAAVARARAKAPILTKIEVEADRLEQVKEALEAGADVIMLDNMTNAEMKEAVALVGGRVPLECSGGVRLETIRGKAETGVDFISVGRITQSAECVDIGLDDRD